MNANKTAHQPLQRRRRRSDQFSPSSPPYTRRLIDRPNRHSDAFSPADSTPATDDSESPSLNLTLASPLYDHFAPIPAPLPSAPPSIKPPSADSKQPQRSFEEAGRPRLRSSYEDDRPATSGALEQNNLAPSSIAKSPIPLPEYGLRPSPVSSYSAYSETRDRRGIDPPIRLGDNASSPSFRNYSFSTQISDRSPQDEPTPMKTHVGKKSRMNLLNPMNLLARRRSAQNQRLEDVNLSINTLVPALPDNFDPSIRGKVVHDFSIPRSRRLNSHSDLGNVDSPGLRWTPGLTPGLTPGPDPARSNDSPNSRYHPGGTPNISHSPMFKEHFQDDRPSLQPERTGYLHNIHAFNIAHDPQDPADVPAFARRLPSAVPQTDQIDRPDSPQKENKPPVPPAAEPSPPPPTPPPKSTPSPKFDIPPPAALPKHMTSTSSRFSFQIGGGGSSAQEKLLEEKHKQHAATKKTNSLGGDEIDEYADYDFDADDGLEEPIPGVNADFEEDDGFGNNNNVLMGNALVARYRLSNYEEDDGFGNDDIPISNALEARYGPAQEEEDGFGNDDIPMGNALEPRYGPPGEDAPTSEDPTATDLQRQSLQGFHFTPQSLTFSPTSTNNASQPTPRDHEGFAIGIADSRAPSQHEHLDFQPKDVLIDVEKVPILGGLGITTAEVHGRRTQQTSRPQGGVFDDEDLYFDDGEFGQLELDPSGPKFDEQLFDDETGKIRDIPADNARRLEAARQAAGADGEVRVAPHWEDTLGRLSLSSNVQTDRPDQPKSASREIQEQKQTILMKGGSVTGLTETNLAAYHDALAFAANQAAANGRFDRKISFSQNSDDTSQSRFESSQHGVISDDSRFSYNYSSAIAEDDGFPFDDDVDDDLMIAEANAEALENDDDGFYGQEFGFYARSHAKGNTEMVNGGYFADRGSNGVKRSHSAKANFQEPSLTPITERSEWSTRNSVVSLLPGAIPASAQSVSSPGIAELLELDSPGHDDDISLSALMKLRGRTFGGSSSSMGSSAAGYSASSPLAHIANTPFAYADYGGGRKSTSIHGRASPAGIPESEEEEEESERPTMTQNTPRKKTVEPVAFTSQKEMPSSPGSTGGERKKGHHSRTSSAESFSYARDSDGGWVLERRRTDEGSGAEVVDREYLVGTL